MSEKLIENFIESLHELEASENTEKIAGLFAENSEIGNSTLTDSFSGTDGARDFWTNYRKTLGEVKSEFKNKIISENAAALEWNTKGTNADGSEIDYDGVSILKHDGAKITRFYAYFNPNELGQQIVKEKAKSSEA